MKLWNYIDEIQKSSSPELLTQFQTNLAQSILGWRKFTFELLGHSHDIYKIIVLLKWIHWFEMVSPVSDVVHGPFVYPSVSPSVSQSVSLLFSYHHNFSVCAYSRRNYVNKMGVALLMKLNYRVSQHNSSQQNFLKLCGWF